MTNGPRPFTVRPAMLADMPSVGRLGALLVRVHHEFDPRRFMTREPDDPR